MNKTGTREWSDVSINCCLGCSHGCLYCYARDQALRYNRVVSGSQWTQEQPLSIERVKKDSKYRRKYDGTVMFPTTHDWTLGSMDACHEALKFLLAAGNKVLLVTKMGVEMVDDVLEAFDASKAQDYSRLEVRISIGGITEATREFWEPGAPSFASRLSSMKVLSGFFTVSASCEPLLEPWHASDLVDALISNGADTVWIGCCNYLRRRTAWHLNELSQRGPRGIDLAGLDAFNKTLNMLEAWQTPEAVLRVVDGLMERSGGVLNPRIRFKDNYREVITRYRGSELPGGGAA